MLSRHRYLHAKKRRGGDYRDGLSHPEASLINGSFSPCKKKLNFF
jgi:hypothetical protein